jgi:preprotein translocase subunit SecD
MNASLKWRIGLIAGLTLLSLFLLVPTLAWDYDTGKSLLPEWWQQSKVLPRSPITLGLDLQGGMHLVIGVNTEEAVENETRRLRERLQSDLQEQKLAFTDVKLTEDRKGIQASFPDAAALDKGTDYIGKNYTILVPAGGKGTLTPSYVLLERQADYLRTNVVKQVRETLMSRVDEFGVAEPSIVTQGKDRILVQLPGVKDPERVKRIIQRTAKLEFMLVDDAAATKEELLAKPKYNGQTPAGTRLVPQKDKEGKIERWYLLAEDSKVTGDNLVDARMSFSQQAMEGSVVSFQFNPEGAREFAKLTGAHIGEPLAIVLEGMVRSAPVIRAKIYDRGQVEGNFSAEEATDLAIVLRAGSLPVNIKIEEERTIGPSLGADLIRKGKVATFWGTAIVVVFMVLYYSIGGLIADLALILNLIFVLACLAAVGATLTLPGIAGIALTMGMSVDANVLIFERMREELRNGKTPRSTIESGYGKALSAIIDSNVTTLLAGVVLYQVGTGPIRGFAVTLSIGIVTSVFTAVVVTRVMYDLMFSGRRRVEKLHIGIEV